MENLWEYLSANDLHLEESNIPLHLKCGICSSLMIRPTLASSCGCVFCKACIREFLGADLKPCPSCLKEDLDTQIMYTDTVECRRSLKEISRIVVKCPFDGCGEMCELRILLDHLLRCDMTKSGCLFKNIGCAHANIRNADMEAHIDAEKMAHFKLICDTLNELKNGVDSQRVGQGDEGVIANELAQLKQQFLQFQSTAKERENELKTAVETVEEKVAVLAMDVVREELIGLRGEIAGLKLWQNRMETDNDDLRKRVDDLSGDNDNLKKRVDNLSGDNNDLKKRVDNLSSDNDFSD